MLCSAMLRIIKLLCSAFINCETEDYSPGNGVWRELCSVTGRFLHHIRTHISLQIFELPEVANLGVACWI